VHIFWITCFIAVVAPFGALFFTAMKRMLKAEKLRKIFTSGSVVDRVDCLIVTGLFLYIYI